MVLKAAYPRENMGWKEPLNRQLIFALTVVRACLEKLRARMSVQAAPPYSGLVCKMIVRRIKCWPFLRKRQMTKVPWCDHVCTGGVRSDHAYGSVTKKKPAWKCGTKTSHQDLRDVLLSWQAASPGRSGLPPDNAAPVSNSKQKRNYAMRLVCPRVLFSTMNLCKFSREARRRERSISHHTHQKLNHSFASSKWSAATFLQKIID